MLFDSFSTQAAQASLDSLWLKSQVITNNMANIDTPRYKAKNVNFEQILNDATDRREAAQARVGLKAPYAEGGAAYRTVVTTDDSTSVRVDGNNVSLEKEETELWKTYAQYSYLLDRISGHYNSINSAINNMRT